MLVHPVHGYLSPLSVQRDHKCICRCIIRIYESGAIEALTVKNRISLVLYCRSLAFNKASYVVDSVFEDFVYLYDYLRNVEERSEELDPFDENLLEETRSLTGRLAAQSLKEVTFHQEGSEIDTSEFDTNQELFNAAFRELFWHESTVPSTEADLNELADVHKRVQSVRREIARAAAAL